MRAVVLGAGIAGLLAARVLAGRSGIGSGVTEVVVVERDPAAVDAAPDPAAADGARARRGVPQGRHLHGLLDGGRRIIEELHPGFTDELAAAGAHVVEPLVDTRWYLHGRRLHPTPTGLRSVLATRPMIESRLRARTAAEFRSGSATGLVLAGGRVTGVRLGEETVPADLVVDATGRASRLPDWLAEAGLSRPREERVDVDLGYTTRLFRRAPGDLGGQLNALVGTVPRSRGGGAMAVEGDRWLVTLAGMLGDHPPHDDEGFRAFAASLPAGPVGELVARAEPLGEAVPYRFRGSRRRRYDLLPDLPEGLLVVGDAACSLNPLYAQGMTLAAQHVRALGEWDGRRARDLHREVGKLSAAAWEIATRADLALPEVEGSRPLPARVLDAYVTRVQRVAHADPVVARALIRVANLVDPATELLTPALLGRVLRPGADRVVAHEERVPALSERASEAWAQRLRSAPTSRSEGER